MTSSRRRADQLLLEYRERRGKELAAIKDVRLGDPLCRLLLFVIDTFIGGQRSYWDETVDVLMNACEMKRTSFYKRLSVLKDLGVVHVEDLPHSPRKRWRIIRSQLDELVEEQSARRTTAAARSGADVEFGSVRLADGSVRQTDEFIRETDGLVRNTDDRVRHADDTTSRPFHVPPAPPRREVDPEMEGVGEICSQMAAVGVRFPMPAVLAALASGCLLAELRAAIDYFSAHAAANGWSPGALQRRITHAWPRMAIDAGWAEAKPTKALKPQPTRAASELEERIAQDRTERERQRRELERLHGASVDAMSDDDWRSLLDKVHRELFTRHGRCDLVRSAVLRKVGELQEAST